ncbi:MAG: thioesterase II family protein [Telluria sp.]
MTRWFYTPQPEPEARLRLFCFPYAGGSAAIFKDWVAPLGPQVELHAVQLPGRGARFGEAPVRSIGLLVHHLATAMAPLLDRPCVFFGHSNGALLAFELARELQRRGEHALRHLIVSAKRAPHLPRLGPITYDLPEAEFIQVLREYEGTPQEILNDPELLRCLLPAIRADFGLSDLYEFRPGYGLACNLSLFGSLNDRYVPYDDLLAWSVHGKGEVRSHVFGGGHFFMHSHADDVIAEVVRTLGEVAGSARRSAA